MLVWTILYAWLCYMMPHKSCEWNCRIVAATHATLIICLGGWSIFVQGPNPFTDPDGVLGGPNTKLHTMVCVICMSYFIYDLIWSVIFQTEAAVMLLHHILSIYGTSFVLYRGLNGAEMMATICGSEITNPFLQLRWFLHESNQHRTWYGELNTVFFILLFTATRVCVGTWFISIYLHHPRPDLAAKIGSFSFYAISMVFWVHIMRYAIKHFKSLYNNWETPELKADDEATKLQPPIAAPDSDSNSSVIIRHSAVLE